MYIYKITNTITKKCYIGQTKRTINRRFRSHISEAKRNLYDTYLHRSIRKYGEENFYIEIVEECDQHTVYEREMFWIKHLNTKSPTGYNLHDGGKGGCLNPSLELKQKLSNSKKNKVPWNKGKKGCQVAWNKGKRGVSSKAKNTSLTKQCLLCGKYHNNKKYCSRVCRGKDIGFQKGCNNGGWNKGITKKTHPEFRHKLSGGKTFHKNKKGPLFNRVEPIPRTITS